MKGCVHSQTCLKHGLNVLKGRNAYVNRPRPQRVTIHASGAGQPYEPLERAIKAINQVIAAGERAGWGEKQYQGESSSFSEEERWVQFGAITRIEKDVNGSTAAVSGPSQQSAFESGALTHPDNKSLSQYLSLPVEQYSLLDPKWIYRTDEHHFLFRVPLQDLVGVEMCPEIQIRVDIDPENGQVTLTGDRALLGAPDIDSSFKLNVVAVLKERRSRRYLPDHLPGRPVYRLRKWAARMNTTLEEHESTILNVPLPGEHIVVSQDESAEVLQGPGEQVLLTSSRCVRPSPSSSSNISNEQMLQCKVNVSMAVRVPSSLRFLPNALLGYVGSTIVKTVLGYTLPNFLSLLSDDYTRWARNEEERNSQLETSVGDLYSNNS